jgi:hypothetical protein
LTFVFLVSFVVLIWFFKSWWFLISVNQLAEFGKFVVGEFSGFDEMGGESAGGTVEDAVDELADHRAGGGGLRDGGGPLVSAAGALAPHEAFVEHDAEHGGDGRGSDFAFTAKRVADIAQGGGAAVPEDAENFEFTIRWVLAGTSGHEDSFFAGMRAVWLTTTNSNELE